MFVVRYGINHTAGSFFRERITNAALRLGRDKSIDASLTDCDGLPTLISVLTGFSFTTMEEEFCSSEFFSSKEESTDGLRSVSKTFYATGFCFTSFSQRAYVHQDIFFVKKVSLGNGSGPSRGITPVYVQ